MKEEMIKSALRGLNSMSNKNRKLIDNLTKRVEELEKRLEDE